MLNIHVIKNNLNPHNYLSNPSRNHPSFSMRINQDVKKILCTKKMLSMQESYSLGCQGAGCRSWLFFTHAVTFRIALNTKDA